MEALKGEAFCSSLLIENWDSSHNCLALNSYSSGIFCVPGKKTRTGFGSGGKVDLCLASLGRRAAERGFVSSQVRGGTNERRREGISFYPVHTHSGMESGAGPSVCYHVGQHNKDSVTQQGKTREGLDDSELIELIHGLHSLCGVVCWSQNVVHITSSQVLCGCTRRWTLAPAPLETPL